VSRLDSQLHSSLAGGKLPQGEMDEVLLPAPALDPDPALDPEPALDPDPALDVDPRLDPKPYSPKTLLDNRPSYRTSSTSIQTSLGKPLTHDSETKPSRMARRRARVADSLVQMGGHLLASGQDRSADDPIGDPRVR
jgi:hypothetical protein